MDRERKKVLDLGCRDGILTRFYAADNVVMGVDIDRKALALAKKSLNIDTMWVDLNTQWPFEENSFDAIVACEIMEHLYVMDEFLCHVRASLRANGIFIGSVPNAFRMRNRMKFLLGNDFETDPTHVRMFSYRKLDLALSKNFFKFKIVPIQGKILPFLKVSPSVPDVLNRLFAKDLLWLAEK